MMVEEKADTSVKTRRNGVLCLKTKGNMGVDGRGDDDVPWVFNRVVAMPEHKSEPEFSAIAETEVADDNQRSVNIAVNAVDIAHPWPMSCLYAGQIVLSSRKGCSQSTFPPIVSASWSISDVSVSKKECSRFLERRPLAL